MTLQLCRWALAFIWLYQGLVPKLLGPHPDELAMSLAGGATAIEAHWIAYIGGTLEVLMGLLILVRYRWRRLYAASAVAVLGLQFAVTLVAPAFLVSAFNALTLSVGMVALSLIAWSELAMPQNRATAVSGAA